MEFWRFGASPGQADPVRLQALIRWRALALILVFGALLSGGAAWVAHRLDHQRIQEILEFRAQWRTQDLQAKITAAAAPIEAVADFVAAADSVDPGAFRRFAGSVVDGDPTRVIGWVPYVAAADRAAFEHAAESDGRGPFAIEELRADAAAWPAAERPYYLPVWLEAHASGATEPLRGLDMMSDPNRRRIVEQGIEGGRPIASPPVHPLAHPRDKMRYLMLWPIYRGPGVPDTVAERRDRLRGFVVAGIDFLSLLADAVRDTPPIPEHIEIYIDGARSEQDATAALYDPAAGGFELVPAAQMRVEEGLAPFLTERHFEVMGRQWTLVFRFPSRTAADLGSSVAWLWLASGLLLTLLAAAYVDRERLTRLQAEALIEERTRELTVAASHLDRESADREHFETALQHHARLMGKTLDATPLALVHLGPGGEVVVWNRGAEAIFGYSALQLIGKPLPALTDTERADLDALVAQMKRGEEVRDLQLDRHHKDGRLIRVNLAAEPIFEGLTFQGFVMALEDLTQRHALEAQLRQAQKMEAIGQLTGGLAHDFNNLLLVILGNLGLLAETLPPDDEESRINCTEARDAALRGAALIRSLLAFARRQPLRPERIDINALIGEQMVLLRRTLGERIEIATELSADLWPVMVDAAQLEAALVNLATNARDAMPRGGRLAIVTRNCRLDEDYAARHPEVTPGDHAVIEVGDTGIGMSEDVTAHIFEPFFTTKERGAGTGLGLSMVFGFLKQSGGHINVHSEVGIGTTFRLFLPRARDPLRPEEEAPAASVPLGQGEKILLVEDSDSIRRLATRMLTQLGYDPTPVSNVADALGYLSGNHTVDLLFTDIVMPGKADGLDLATVVRERWPSVKILLTSGFPDNDGRRDLADFDLPLLSKPYQREELARMVRAVLEK